MTDHQFFGATLRRYRLENSLSLRDFSQLVHYSVGYLSKIENGFNQPNISLALACEKALGLHGQLTGALEKSSGLNNFPLITQNYIYRLKLYNLVDSFQSTDTRIIELTGKKGTGKTTFAIHWAMENTRSFDDMHYIDLTNFTTPQKDIAWRSLVQHLIELTTGEEYQAASNYYTDLAIYKKLISFKKICLIFDHVTTLPQDFLTCSPGSMSIIITETPLGHNQHTISVDTISVDNFLEEEFAQLTELIAERKSLPAHIFHYSGQVLAKKYDYHPAICAIILNHINYLYEQGSQKPEPEDIKANILQPYMRNYISSSGYDVITELFAWSGINIYSLNLLSLIADKTSQEILDTLINYEHSQLFTSINNKKFIANHALYTDKRRPSLSASTVEKIATTYLQHLFSLIYWLTPLENDVMFEEYSSLDNVFTSQAEAFAWIKNELESIIQFATQYIFHGKILGLNDQMTYSIAIFKYLYHIQKTHIWLTHFYAYTLELAHKTGSQRIINNIQRMKAVHLTCSGEPQAAVEILTALYKDQTQQDEFYVIDQGWTCVAIGFSYDKLSRYAAAGRYYQEALKLYGNNVCAGWSVCTINYIYNLIKVGQHAKALELCDRAISEHYLNEDRDYIGKVFTAQGLCYAALCNKELHEIKFHSAVEALSESHNHCWINLIERYRALEAEQGYTQELAEMFSPQFTCETEDLPLVHVG